MLDRAEDQLIQEAKEGSHEAFRKLVQRHMKQAYNVAYGFLHDHDEADDISQEAFVKVHASLDSFRGDSEFGTWLHRIVANLSMSRLRQRKRKSQREVALDQATLIPDQANSETEPVERTEIIERILHELPTLQRAVVILRHLEGLSTKQVSRILDCSEGTVKTHLHRGLKRMRSQLTYLKQEALA